ncbi:MAG: orotidine-5'-phosphate decarboxylase [Phycisphaeraceae bacterium]|nr:orotidine-5'-phosphate decarboxylase [Phycisphaeraceae bacterium]
MTHFADRLLSACDKVGSPVCVGIDPVLERLPEGLAADGSAVERIEAFGLEIIEAVADRVPAVKPQSACFERYGAAGVAAYDRIVASARSAGLIVIGDAKRGDIGTSAAHYAAGCLVGAEGAPGPDALTINSYFGHDGIQPFVDAAAPLGRGLFALVRTSNPGGDAIQDRQLADGGTVAEAVAELIAQLGAGTVGEQGYSLLGAVVGATKPEDAARLRKLMPRQIFLVPGYGAQGGGAEDVLPCFHDDGRGAIVTSSRSVIYAQPEGGSSWQQAVADAADGLAEAVASVL